MVKPKWIAGAAVLLFVGWALWYGTGLRTFARGGYRNIDGMLSLEIVARNPNPGPGELAHIVVRLRNVTGEPFQAPAPGLSPSGGYLWRITGPNGEEIAAPDASELDRVLEDSRLRGRWWSGAGLDTIRSELDRVFYLDDPLRDSATHPPGTYRVSLRRDYSYDNGYHEDNRPRGVKSRRNRPRPPPRPRELARASGVLESNELIITRRAGK